MKKFLCLCVVLLPLNHACVKEERPNDLPKVMGMSVSKVSQSDTTKKENPPFTIEVDEEVEVIRDVWEI